MSATMTAETSQVIGIIRELGKLESELGPDDDFYEAGFSSINSLELLMELEDRFAVSLPDDRFIEARTPRALTAMVDAVRGEQPR